MLDFLTVIGVKSTFVVIRSDDKTRRSRMNEISNRELIVKKKKIAKSTTGAEATEKD